MCNPTAYKRLRAEIDELGGDILDATKLAHLPYLNASMFVPTPLHISQRIFLLNQNFTQTREPPASPPSPLWITTHTRPRKRWEDGWGLVRLILESILIDS